ncbi:MAG: hypothetical protein KatS3mg087_1604 [Patescibacteria group bacterium]|nr:MAG: hypothetical protein KatS3mg087_1604 [Patescibacteria group bacterium]
MGVEARDMPKNRERILSRKLTDAEIAHIALERTLPKRERLSREWAITPEDLEGMSEQEKAEWLALARNSKLTSNRGMTRKTRGTMEDRSEGRGTPESGLPSMSIPRGTRKLRKI